MISPQRIRQLMIDAVHEASQSKVEDARPHPFVGAVLADDEGNIIRRAHRGQIHKMHAECALFHNEEPKFDPARSTLFVTLEPCTSRGKEKIPCAERVVASGVRTVYIGTLDPNPTITGCGEMYLVYSGVEVHRFDADLRSKLFLLSKTFFDSYRNQHVHLESLYSGNDASKSFLIRKPLLRDDRNGLLTQTLDMISGSKGPIWIVGGDLSWLREAIVALLQARLENRQVTICCSSPEAPSTFEKFEDAKNSALAIGCNLVELESRPGLKGTIVTPFESTSAAVVLDRENAHLFRSPRDAELLSVVTTRFQQIIEGGIIQPGADVQIERIPIDALVRSLKKGVLQYRSASIEFEAVELAKTRPLTNYLERFKFRRLNLLESLHRHYGLSLAARVVGSPWPITPPVIEVADDGTYVIVDGTHRTFAALQRGEEKMEALVVRGVNGSLPGFAQNNWDGVRCYDTKLPRVRRYQNFVEGNFRLIRRAFRTLTGA